jgi:hypothetical protein
MKMKTIPAEQPIMYRYRVEPSFVEVRNKDAHIGERI